MNARQKRLFEEARRKNPDLKVPAESQQVSGWTEDDLALVKQGVGDKTSRASAGPTSGAAGPEGSVEQTGSIVTYFEDKGFGFVRPDGGGRDIFFHISRLTEGSATDLTAGTKVTYELGMDRTGKTAASSIRVSPAEA